MLESMNGEHNIKLHIRYRYNFRIVAKSEFVLYVSNDLWRYSGRGSDDWDSCWKLSK